MEKFIKSEIRKVAKGNHNLHTLLNYVRIQFPSAVAEDYSAFITDVLSKKQAKVLAQPFYAGRNIRY